MCAIRWCDQVTLLLLTKFLCSLVAQRVKRLPAMQETQVRSLGWEDPLEKEMATHSSTLAWRIPWREEPGRLQSTGVAKSQTWLSDFTFTFMLSIYSVLPETAKLLHRMAVSFFHVCQRGGRDWVTEQQQLAMYESSSCLSSSLCIWYYHCF